MKLKAMVIGIDARMYGPRQTGIGNYIKYLIEHLARIDQKNSYYLFFRKEEYAKFQIPNSKFYKALADFPWYSFAEQTLFLQTLLKYPLDLMHFPHFNVPLFYNKPFIVTIHDLTPKFFPGEKVGKSWLRRKAYKAVLNHAITKSKAIITPSQFTKNDILKYYTVNPQKIFVIPQSIPLPQTVYGNKKAKKLTKLVAKSYILYVGVWRSHKNLEGLVKAFKILKEEGLPHKLVIIGDPDIYYEQVARLWTKLGLKRDIIAPGFQDDNVLVEWYKHASLLVLPSFYEGFGLTPLTALSLSVPVAVSNIGALRETLGDSAFYFDPKSPEDMARVMKKALTDKKSAKAKLSRARALLKRYSWEKTADETLKVYVKAGR